MNARDRALKALNRLTKFRTVYAGWQLGTRPDDDPECQAVRDAVEARLVLRVEATALARLCIQAGVFTEEQFHSAVAVEADFLTEALERQFPGFTATDEGLVIDPLTASETMKGWRP